MTLTPELEEKIAAYEASREEEPPWEPLSERTVDDAELRQRFRPIDMAAVLDGHGSVPPPIVLRRDDGAGLFYSGRLNMVMGETEGGKTLVATYAAAQELKDGCHVIYVDFEDVPGAIAERLIGYGVSREAIIERFSYIESPPGFGLTAREEYELLIVERGAPSLVVIDGVTEAMFAAGGLNPDVGVDVAAFFAGTPKYFARLGAAVAMIDHVTKDREGRGRWAIGSERKISGLDGAAYLVENITPFGRGRSGSSRLIVSKDRNGHVRQQATGGKVMALFEMTSYPDGGLSASLSVPRDSITDGGAWRPTGVMERLSKAIEKRPGLTKRALRELVKSRGTTTDLALELLIAEGYVTVEKGPRGALEHVSARAFREGADDAE